MRLMGLKLLTIILMLFETTNYYETPQKKAGKDALYSKSSSKLKDRKDKRKKTVFSDLIGVSKAIDFNRCDDKVEVSKLKQATKEPKIKNEKITSNSMVTKLR